MSDTTHECRRGAAWNVLADRWLDVMDLNAEAHVYSPLEALSLSSDILRIAAASPLDLFAAHRFLLTLLYWKADVAGGVQPLRESLVRGDMPKAVLAAIESETPSFRLFDGKAPFLQDTSAPTAKSTLKSAGYLFAEFATGTNVAHFHHGADKEMRLCKRCAAIGMLRLVPWTQSGGSGLTPAIHGSPPIMAIAKGANLATTLGLNLVPLSGKAGVPMWAGHFKPSNTNAAIPYLEALTWNPRRVQLLSVEKADVCWRCGREDVDAIGQIVFAKNDNTKKRSDNTKKGSEKLPFIWEDPAAFYAGDKPYITMKSTREELAAHARDLAKLVSEDKAPASAVITANPNHQEWQVVIPCTMRDPNNKTFDHRQLELAGVFLDGVRSKLPAPAPPLRPVGLDGWKLPRPAPRNGGAAVFVRATARFLTPGDWAVISAVAYQHMHYSPAAFDIFSGLLWPLRGKVDGLPSRSVLWLVLKLMAVVPSRARIPKAKASFNPLQSLPTRQVNGPGQDRSGALLCYPASFPRGRRLEAELRAAIDTHLRKRFLEPVDWAGLCHGLNQLID